MPVNKRVLKNGKVRWQANYYDREHHRHFKNFDRKIDAREWLDQVTADQVTGSWVDPKKARGTVDAEATAWLATHSDWKVTTRVRNESAMKNHVLPRWGGVQLGQITTDAVQRWVNDMGGTPGTVRKNVGVLSSILDHAVTMRRLGVNPCKGVTLPRQVKKQRRYLTDIEVQQLVDAAGDHGLVVQVLAYCGLRWGELAALKVGNVDLGRRRLTVEASVTEVGVLVWSDPKDYQRRSVPYPPFLDAAMAGQVKDRARDQILFPVGSGQPMREGNARRDWFDKAVTASGIGYLTPHELRHTAASLAVRSGASVLAVQRMLGHEKPSTTLDVYSDLFEDDLDTVMVKVSAARAEALAVAQRLQGQAPDRDEPPGQQGVD